MEKLEQVKKRNLELEKQNRIHEKDRKYLLVWNAELESQNQKMQIELDSFKEKSSNSTFFILGKDKKKRFRTIFLISIK